MTTSGRFSGDSFQRHPWIGAPPDVLWPGLARLDCLLAMGRRCQCARDRADGCALLLSHALDAVEADLGLLFTVEADHCARLVAHQGIATLMDAVCAKDGFWESLMQPVALSLELELAPLFAGKLGLPPQTRTFEAPLIGNDGPCGVLVLFWAASTEDGESRKGRGANLAQSIHEREPLYDGFGSADGAPALDAPLADLDCAWLDRVVEQCAQVFERLSLGWNLERALSHVEALNRRQARQEAFFSLVSHELRAPMTSLKNGAELLCQVEQPEHRARAAAIVHRSLRRQLRLVEDLTDLSRIMLGRFQFRRSRFDLRDVLRASLEDVEPEIERAGLELRRAESAAPLVLCADRDRIAQAIDSLLSNALRYTDEGFIGVQAFLDQNLAVIVVEDSGRGIDARRIPTLFEPFWSESASFEESRGGLGIGLSIAQWLVQAQGGALCASSDGPGRGSRFEMRLPLAD